MLLHIKHQRHWTSEVTFSNFSLLSILQRVKELEDENAMLKEKVNILQESSVICGMILTTSLKLVEDFGIGDSFGPQFLGLTWQRANTQ